MIARFFQKLKGTHPLLLLLLIVYAAVITRTAWVNEDAYITLRTVDNFIHGYGLRWNVAERVQTFTHPLWLILVTIPYFFTREAFYTVIFLSIAVSITAFYILTLNVRGKEPIPQLALLTILVFSKAYVDYSTSGFENPITHLLVAVFLLLFLDQGIETLGRGRLLALCLFVSLAMLNRMDTALLFLPPMALLAWKGLDRRTWKFALLGFLPFIVWEIFSVVYYGFPFPNTAYAKLNTSIPQAQLLEKGMLYVVDALWRDPITPLTIALGTVFAAFYGQLRERLVALGIVLYLAYVIWIGADYMSGRFFSVLVMMAVVLLVRYFNTHESRAGLFILVLVIALGFAAPMPTLTSVNPSTYSSYTSWGQNRIDDWRLFSFLRDGGLITSRLGRQEPSNDWSAHGKALREADATFDIFGKIGYAGYFAGPKVYMMDPCALSDPFLARLKPVLAPSDAWQSGHFPRAIPAGYPETVQSGVNQIQDPGLSEYYANIALITRGPLFSRERIAAIWKANTGQLDPLLANQPVETMKDPACDFVQ